MVLVLLIIFIILAVLNITQSIVNDDNSLWGWICAILFAILNYINYIKIQ
jgi:hypothetical protein